MKGFGFRESRGVGGGLFVLDVFYGMGYFCGFRVVCVL